MSVQDFPFSKHDEVHFAFESGIGAQVRLVNTAYLRTAGRFINKDECAETFLFLNEEEGLPCGKF
jgi:hypothetical protein